MAEDQPSNFKLEWEAKKILKRAKKKATHKLREEGKGRREARSLVNSALKKIASENREKVVE